MRLRSSRSRTPKSELPTLEDVAEVLRAEDQEKLARLLLEWAKDDNRLHERLIQYAARRQWPDIAGTTSRGWITEMPGYLAKSRLLSVSRCEMPCAIIAATIRASCTWTPATE